MDLEQATRLAEAWGLPIAVLLGGVAWVVVAWINRFCCHKWENLGGVRNWKIKDRETDFLGDEFRQTVQCSKCGKLSWFRVG